MVFSGVTFLFFFLPCFLLVYFLTPEKYRNITLLIGSILFYQWGAPWFVFVILASTWVDFHIVKRMHRSTDRRVQKKWLIASLIINLGLLAWFKYANFFVDNVQSLFETMGLGTFTWMEVMLPIGISFYTFQTITYAVDVYRGTHDPLRKPSDYMMYILMFPQLIAGPIVRFHEVADQIEHRQHKWSAIQWGILRFSLGLAKKVLIANVLGQSADEIFRQDAAELTAATAWIGALAYTFQIYFDFSGYSEMAIGLGYILGFKFPENFNAPYISRNITEFWRRWHMTLSRFMRDYLYIPLGGNRRGSGRTYANLVIVFLLSGLWHGAAWNFVIWGAFHGIFLLLDRLFLLRLTRKLGSASVILTFFITVIGWVIFRVEDLSMAGSFYSTMFSAGDWNSLYLYDVELLLTLGIAIFFSFMPMHKLGSGIMERFYSRETDIAPGRLLQYTGILLLAVTLFFVISGDFDPFIYFRF